MKNRDLLFTIACSSMLGECCTSMATSIEELIEEMNSTFACDEYLTRAFIEHYNENVEALGKPIFEGEDEDFTFELVVENDPRHEEGGWGFVYTYINEFGQEDHCTLNISVHRWNGKFYDSQG